VEASVIVPVRNRKETIAEAVKSALSQETDFPFNVIVVDNHSTDGTTFVLFRSRQAVFILKHVVPKRVDLASALLERSPSARKPAAVMFVQLDFGRSLQQ